MKRALLVVCTGLLFLAGLVAPAAADSGPAAATRTTRAAAAAPPFLTTFSNGIACPRPWVNTGFGALSMCTELGGSLGGAGWYGPNSRGLPDWANDLPILNTVVCVWQGYPATDGTKGTVITPGRLDAGGFGQIRPGMQYLYFGFQPIGRPGNVAAGVFHPVGDWQYASGDIETNFDGCL